MKRAKLHRSRDVTLGHRIGRSYNQAGGSVNFKVMLELPSQYNLIVRFIERKEGIDRAFGP